MGCAEPIRGWTPWRVVVRELQHVFNRKSLIVTRADATDPDIGVAHFGSWRNDGSPLHSDIPPHARANARLFADAINTANATGLTPGELAAEVDGMRLLNDSAARVVSDCTAAMQSHRVATNELRSAQEELVAALTAERDQLRAQVDRLQEVLADREHENEKVRALLAKPSDALTMHPDGTATVNYWPGAGEAVPDA